MTMARHKSSIDPVNRRNIDQPYEKKESETHFAIDKGPKVDADANEIVQGWIGSLIHEDGRQAAQRVYHQACLNRAMYGVASNPREWPLPREDDEAEHQVHDL